jgi:NAD+ synthase (glutamine-hydrolysing)
MDKQKLRIVIAQLNFLVGDIFGNAQKIIASAKLAQQQYAADLVVFPELALTAYPPEDLLFRSDFQQQVSEALASICQQVMEVDMVIGLPHKVDEHLYNAAVYIQDGKPLAYYHKQQLPNYGVFDEKRYFTPGSSSCIITKHGIKIGLLICEDLWFAAPAFQAKQAGAELLLSINASPFDLNKEQLRLNVLRQRVVENSLPIVYVHGVGGQDEVIFDGGSCALDATATLSCQAPYFTENLLPIDILVNDGQLTLTADTKSAGLSEEALAYEALVLGIKDYVAKNHFPGVLIGLSGGIDSALTLVLAVDALGADKVQAVSMPSRYTSQMSIDLAVEMAELLKVKLSTIPIEPMFQSFLQGLNTEFKGQAVDQSEENIQARCRGTLLMALSNKTGKLVLTTGNKSEMAVGYATLYGDMAGGLAVLKDVFKTLVYRLANYRNALSPAIPQLIIDRPPTAELKEGQTDQDTLPPYAVLDQILALYIEQDQSIAQITAQGFDRPTVQRVISMVNRNEYKRRQAPPGIRITQRAFGRDRRYPLTSGFTPS